MNTSEAFLVALLLVFAVPYIVWRLSDVQDYAPLVVVQVIAGLILGPSVLGAAFPAYYKLVFTPAVITSLSGISLWAVALFVMLAGVELDLVKAWSYRRESGITATFALAVPLSLGCLAGAGLALHAGWMGPNCETWQFVVGVGMACAVTALPVLIMLLEEMDILRQPLGQRALRYASLDDIAIWGVLAVVLLDWSRVGAQLAFLVGFGGVTWAFRKLMRRLQERDRWFVAMIWLAACSFAADWVGLHYMVGAFLAGAAMDSTWFDQENLDRLRSHLLLTLMPVYFLNSGLRTNWEAGSYAVFVVAAGLLVTSVIGKLLGVRIAGHILGWEKREASIIGWLLQTKGLVTIVFANVLLDKGIITGATFTAVLLTAVGSTMLTTPMVYRLASPAKLKLILRSQ